VARYRLGPANWHVSCLTRGVVDEPRPGARIVELTAALYREVAAGRVDPRVAAATLRRIGLQLRRSGHERRRGERRRGERRRDPDRRRARPTGRDRRLSRDRRGGLDRRRGADRRRSASGPAAAATGWPRLGGDRGRRSGG